MKVRFFGKLEYSPFADCSEQASFVNLRTDLDSLRKVVAESAEMREVFIRSSGHGGCEGLLGALGRDISLYLQAGAYTDEKVRREIRSLSKTACAACIRNKAAEAKSCSAAVAKCMQREYEYLQQTRRTIMVTEKLEAIDLDKIASIAEPAQDTWNCPECGTVNVDNGGCKTCR